MNLDILMPIVIISAIAVGLGIFLCVFLKGDEEKFDERQLIERGRGANLAVFVAVSYLLTIYAGYALNLLPVEHTAIFAVYGLAVTMTVYSGYCIFHDAFLNREQELGPEVLKNVGFGAVCLVDAFLSAKWDKQNAWIDGALALDCLAAGVMLLLRELILRIQDRMAAKENADG